VVEPEEGSVLTSYSHSTSQINSIRVLSGKGLSICRGVKVVFWLILAQILLIRLH